jgi:glutamine---fructose-6-phosphate transaminase (isomerizing)
MCGILGYIGDEAAFPILLQCLKSIAYRGYDSCGMTLVDDKGLHTVKAVGHSDALNVESAEALGQKVGIAHTRWATHGEPSDSNAHPHLDCTGDIAIAHNGIVENYAELKRQLLAAGHQFGSETDSEVIAHMLEDAVGGGLELEDAVRKVAPQLEGAYAFVAVQSDDPERIVGVRHDCPLIVATGHGDDAVFFTSDAAAILNYCSDIVVLENGQLATISSGSMSIMDLSGETVPFQKTRVEWDRAQAQRGGYDHFMIKEIHEQPAVVRDLLHERITEDGDTFFPELDEILPESVDRIVVAACGTASYVCAFAKLVLEDLTGLPVLAEVGSEFRYRRHFLNRNSLFIAISQSGETADTIASVRMAKDVGAPVLGIVNVLGTTIAREADRVIYTRGGPEAAVPSTKVFLNQLVCAQLIGLHLAKRFGESDRAASIGKHLAELPEVLTKVLAVEDDIRRIAAKYQQRQSWFAIGRGLDEPLAREAALKLKEVAYVHAESLPAGELKHGPIALIEEGMPVLALVTQPHVRSKMANNIQEVAARRGTIVAFSTVRDDAIEDAAADFVLLPTVSRYVDPILMAVPLQLLSYYSGVMRGTNVDYPRNLAKSVTVE